MKTTNTVTITAHEYAELIRDSERLDALHRMLTSQEYCTTRDVLALIGREKKKEAEDDGKI